MAHLEQLKAWLVSPPLTGGRAFAAAIGALAVPTLIRASIDPIVSADAVGFAVYVPFVLLSAVLMGWRHAILVALVSATIADALFVGPPRQLLEGPTDLVEVVVFLLSSALVIGLVQAIRNFAEDGLLPGTECPDGVIFSSDHDQAWASWTGAHSRARLSLGRQDEVVEMMKDFLAQMELGKRLVEKFDNDVTR